MNSRVNRNKFPAWLWFFLAIPAGVIMVLLYRQRWGRGGARRLVGRYTEPDSIPLDMNSLYSRADTGAGAAGSQAGGDTAEQAARMDDESPATANESSDIAEEQRIGGTPPAPRTPEPVRKQNVRAIAEETGGTEDDLKIIEGIGPTIAGLLRERGITTFRQLAETPVERLSEILTQARLNRLADPATWPEQARLAAGAEWDQLEAFQQTLKGGRRVK